MTSAKADPMKRAAEIIVECDGSPHDKILIAQCFTRFFRERYAITEEQERWFYKQAGFEVEGSYQPPTY